MALDGVDLAVEAGRRCSALLGPNGAGKTSLVSIVAGLRRPDAGRVRVCGHRRRARPRAACGATSGSHPRRPACTSRCACATTCGSSPGSPGCAGASSASAIDEVATALGLDALLDRRASELSGGERRRLHTAIALVHRPALVLLDEPTTGADVRTRAEILDLVRDLAADGSAVVYSTHYLHEVEQLDATSRSWTTAASSRAGALAELVRRHGASALELTFDGDVPAVGVRRRRGRRRVDRCGSRPTIPPRTAAHAAAAPRRRRAARCGRSRSIRPDLESVFLAVTGRRYDAEHPRQAA